MSTSATSRPNTSDERSPQNTISPATARSRHARRLSSSATTSRCSSVFGSRLASRTRNGERRLGARDTCASIPPRSPADAHLASRPLGIGFGASGSRIDRNENTPDTAAKRKDRGR